MLIRYARRFVNRWGCRMRPAPKMRPAPRFRPTLEGLEDRTVPSTVNWIGSAGDWSDPSHWLDATTLTNHTPTAADDAVLDTGAAVTHATGTDPVLSVSVASGSLTLTGGTLDIAGTLSAAGTFKLAGGTLADATVAAGTTVAVTGGTLSGATFTGDLDMATASGATTVINGLTLNGTAYLGDAAGTTASYLQFSGTQTLSGSGAVLFGGNGNNALYVLGGAAGSTLTIGPNVLVHGKNGAVGFYSGYGLVNQGTISADTAGGTILVRSDALSSAGTLQATDGGTLTLAGAWSNTGTLEIDLGSTVTAPATTRRPWTARSAFSSPASTCRAR